MSAKDEDDDGREATNGEQGVHKRGDPLATRTRIPGVSYARRFLCPRTFEPPPRACGHTRHLLRIIFMTRHPSLSPRTGNKAAAGTAAWAAELPFFHASVRLSSARAWR